jgi:hypothetical protein
MEFAEGPKMASARRAMLIGADADCSLRVGRSISLERAEAKAKCGEQLKLKGPGRNPRAGR